MEDPVAAAEAHDSDSIQAEEATPLLRGNDSNSNKRHSQEEEEEENQDDDTPRWYWPWPATYWAAIPVIFLAGLSIGPAIAMTAPLIKFLFCERGIPDLFKDKNRDHFNALEDEKDCDSAEYSAAIAKFAGIFGSLSAVLVTLTVRFWNSLSDRIGRKKTMLVWAIGTTVAQTLPLLVYYNEGMSVYFIWVGGMIEGAVGSVLCLIALVHSYAADVTHPEQRTVVFGRMIAGWYAGLGHNKPKMANSQSQATLIEVDNDGAEESRTPSPSSTFNKPRTALHHQQDQPSWIDRVIQACLPEQLPYRLGGKYSIIKLMITCLLALMAVMGAMYQSGNYLLYRFKWTGTELSYVGAVQGLSRLVSLTVLLPLLKRLAPPGSKSNPAVSINFDLKVVIMGLWMEALTMLIYAVTPIGEGFYLGGVTGAIGSLFFPATRGILSQSVAPELLGKTLGTLATFESLAAIVAPLMFAWIYALTLETHPSTVFYVSSAATLLASALAISVVIEHRKAVKLRA
ncbi:hypothetical protein BGX29_009117 [Mortierella sp. GBA35]|nr:hypothetical protein BGX29_009117 [Mortierella sp. GBA35]